MNDKFHKFLFLLIFLAKFYISHAKSENPISDSINFNQTVNSSNQWKNPPPFLHLNVNPRVRFLLAGSLSFLAAAISSAGGIGGGGLFIPILIIAAGLDVTAASSYSAFMVTGGSIANVGSHILVRSGGKKPLIDYDIALLSEPSMLLGVSCGVILNLVLPEWLITILFVIFIAFCTFKTCKSGVLYWKLESRGLRRNGFVKMEDCGESTEVPLLNGYVDEGKSGTPWLKLGMLVVIWFSFLALYLLRGNRYGQGIVEIEVCGIVYWIISVMQIPLAIIFTTWILLSSKGPKNNDLTQQENGGGLTRSQSSYNKLIFPIMALLAGCLGGVFGIGGGMLISPLLLQLRIEPEVTAATCSFMVLFSSTMSAIQYLLLGMEGIYGALSYAVICFVGSLIGLTLVQQAIMKHGRASLIVFSVGTVMALSTVLMTTFGVVDVWTSYSSGKSMGFKTPCNS